MSASDIDNYIAEAPQEAQEKLNQLREIIKHIIPDAQETISYGIPTFKMHGKYVVYIAGYKSHVSIHPLIGSIEDAIPEVTAYKTGKGTMQLPIDKPLPFPLIKKVVEYLVKENQKRTGKGGADE